MQASPEQLGAYYLWLKDRGIRFPVKARTGAQTAAPVDVSAPSSPPVAKRPIQVAFVSDQPLTAPERDLLDKMIAAMQLTGEHAILESLEDLPAFTAAHCISLMIPLGQVAAAACPGDTEPTLHPRDLLLRPENKRTAWNDLKRAMARLKA